MRGLAPLLVAASAAGLIVGDALVCGARWWLALASLACAFAGLARRWPCGSAAAASLAAFAASAALMGIRVERSLESLASSPRAAVIEGRVAGVERGSGRTRVDLEAVAWVDPADAAPERIQLWIEGSPAPPLGVRIRAAIRTRQLGRGSANPGSPDPARALARRGIGASAQLADPMLLQIVEDSGISPWNYLENRRLRAIDRLRALGRGGALLAALSLGDQAALPERDRRAWAALGIAHLLSVSGLHLALAAAGAYALFATALRHSPALCARADTRRLALLAALASAALYAELAGLAVPALRSLVALAALALGALARRPTSAVCALSLAALCVLALEPSALFEPGPQLSFAATAALVLGRGTGAEREAGALRRALANLVATSARATLATAPIAALHFGAAPPLAGAANLLAVPLTAALGMPVALAAGACALLAPQSASADGVLASAAWLAERGLDAAAGLAAAAPHVAPHPPAASALLVSAGLCAFGLRTRRLSLCAASALAAQLALAAIPAPPVAPPLPRVVFLDVGHGDAALVQARGFAMLVDSGAAAPDGWDAGARIVVPALAALGVRRLDALAITHADLDHRGGASAVLEALPCGELWLPHGALRDAAFAPLAAEARARAVRVLERGAGDAPIERAGVRVAPLWPPRETRGLSDNDRSLVLRVELAGARILLLGDLEAPGESALLASGAELRADVLKLAHHGSRSSSTAGLLDAARPRLAVASAPLRGRFHWPDREVRERLAARRVELAWTGRDGALLVRARTRPCLRRWRWGSACLAF